MFCKTTLFFSLAATCTKLGGRSIWIQGHRIAALFLLTLSYVHAAGGLCILDEVQTGFGRAGDYFWIYESQGITMHR